MRLRTLQSRIVVFFLVLLALVQGGALFLLQHANERNARNNIRQELDVGERVFRRLSEQNVARLTQAVEILSLDFAFRQAVATLDLPTIQSVLLNHGARIQADRMALLSLDRLFQADFDDGSLDLLALSPLSLETVAAVKIAAHWLTTGLPLTLLSPLLGTMFGLSPGETGTLALSLLIGTPSVSALGAVGAALTLSIRRGGLILPLLVLPLLAPAVIFGASAVQAGPDGTFVEPIKLHRTFQHGRFTEFRRKRSGTRGSPCGSFRVQGFVERLQPPVTLTIAYGRDAQ